MLHDSQALIHDEGVVIYFIRPFIMENLMSLLEFRLATASDLRFIDVLMAYENEHGHFSDVMNDPSVHAKWMTDVSNSIATALRGEPAALSVQIFMADGQKVGAIILRSAPNPNEIDLNVLVVSPQYRRKGYARQAVIDLMLTLEQQDKKVLVRCFPASTEMMALLCSLGFAERHGVGVQVRHFLSPSDLRPFK